MNTLPPLLLSLLFASLSTQALADPWTFQQPIDVTTRTGKKIFHHLESSGRRNITVSEHTVAITWEDNRDGVPRVYLARKQVNTDSFSPEIMISGKDEAFEPSLAALPDNRFVIAWEENEHVYMRVVDDKGVGPIMRASKARAAQASLYTQGEKILLVLSDQSKRYGRIMLYTLRVGHQLKLSLENHCAADPVLPKDQQTYPTVVTMQDTVVVAWEDRRRGHTVIMASNSKPGKACPFNAPIRISENWRSNQSATYGKGTGAARVAMAAYGSTGVLAVWADKRNFREGYDIFSADRLKNGSFDHNVRVQDAFGSVSRQWHPTVAGTPGGMLVVAWDDDRDGTPDIVLSWRENGKWSDNLGLPGATGSGEQTHPSITLDKEGNLHAAWVERKMTGGPTRLRYAFGKKLKVAD